MLGHDHLGVNDNVFEIDDDSVRVVRVQARLEMSFGQSISPAKLFENYTINTLARYLTSLDTGDTRSRTPEDNVGTHASESWIIEILQDIQQILQRILIRQILS